MKIERTFLGEDLLPSESKRVARIHTLAELTFSLSMETSSILETLSFSVL